MKRLIMSGLIISLILKVGCSEADNIRITAINDSATAVNLVIGSTLKRTISLGSANIKMFTADYKYPEPIKVLINNQYPVFCTWSMPKVGKQVIRMITMNINVNNTTHTTTCVLDSQR